MNFTRAAFVLSYVSLIVTILAFIAGLVLAAVTSSSATLGFALENAVDFLSSVLVCWRFWGGGATVPEATLELREKRASVGIAMSFVILALTVGGVACGHLTTHDPPSNLPLLLGVSIPSMIIFFILGSLKLWVGYATRSASMKKDAACSLCGAVLSLGVCIGAAAVGADPKLWFIDAVVALFVSLGLLVYGVYVCAKNASQGNAWWTLQFWQSGGVPRTTVRGTGLGELQITLASSAPRTAPAGLTGDQRATVLEDVPVGVPTAPAV